MTDLDDLLRSAAEAVRSGVRPVPPPLSRSVARREGRQVLATVMTVVLVLVAVVGVGRLLDRSSGRPVDHLAFQTSARISVGGAPSRLAVGADALWVLDARGSIVRIDPLTEEITGRFGLGGLSQPDVVAVDAASVWVGCDNGVVRLDPHTGRVLATIHGSADEGDLILPEGRCGSLGTGVRCSGMTR